MDEISQYAKKIIALEKKGFKLVFNNKKVKDVIIYLNTEAQLYDKGIDSEGASLGEYSPFTIEGTANFKGKKEKGQRYDHITLKDTGDFYESFKVKVTKDYFEISANPKKGDNDLFVDFGDDVLGLTDESFRLLLPILQEAVEDVLNNIK